MRTSLDRKIREQEKELSTLNESRRRRRAAAKDVYNAIGFDAMYKDGICQVEEGLFSQTIAFEDISYQSAREENQQAIFSAYCQLFDYFGAESCVQLSVVNTPIPASEIGRKRSLDVLLPDGQLPNRRVRHGERRRSMRVAMFALGAFLVTCAAIGWCCASVGGTWDEDEIDF